MGRGRALLILPSRRETPRKEGRPRTGPPYKMVCQKNCHADTIGNTMETNNEPVRVVYVANLGPHDFSEAEEYGDIVYLTKGPTSNQPAKLAQEIVAGLSDSDPDDYLVLSGPSLVCGIVATVFALMHGGRLNLLLYRGPNQPYHRVRLSLQNYLENLAEEG